jgi:hypothetical protein
MDFHSIDRFQHSWADRIPDAARKEPSKILTNHRLRTVNPISYVTLTRKIVAEKYSRVHAPGALPPWVLKFLSMLLVKICLIPSWPCMGDDVSWQIPLLRHLWNIDCLSLAIHVDTFRYCIHNQHSFLLHVQISGI